MYALRISHDILLLSAIFLALPGIVNIIFLFIYIKKYYGITCFYSGAIFVIFIYPPLRLPSLQPLSNHALSLCIISAVGEYMRT